MTVAGVLTSLVVAMVAAIAGMEYGTRVGDTRGIIGGVFGLLVLWAGLAWTFGW